MTDCKRRPGSTWTSCRCYPCRVYNAGRLREARAGALPPSDQAGAWEALDALLAAGLTLTAIGDTAAVSERTIRKALAARQAGQEHRWRRDVIDRLKAAADSPAPARGRIRALGATRRLQALAADGYDATYLAQHTHLAIGFLRALRAGRCSTLIDVRAHQEVARLFTLLDGRPGDSRTSRALAARKGWAPGVAWDEDTIDDPGASPQGIERLSRRQRAAQVDLYPDEVAVHQVMSGHHDEATTREVDRDEAIYRLHDQGHPASLVADRARVVKRTVERVIRVRRLVLEGWDTDRIVDVVGTIRPVYVERVRARVTGQAGQEVAS